MKRLPQFFGLLAVALLCGAALAETPSPARLLERAQRNMTPVNDYIVDLRFDVKGQNITIKGMTMTFYFKKPAKTRVVARQGFAAMPSSVMMVDALTALVQNSRPTLLKAEKKQGMECYVIRLDPFRRGNQPPTTLWLDKSHLLVRATRFEGPFPVKSEWRYARVDEKYDLPRRIDADITAPQSTGFGRRGRRDPDEHSRRPKAYAASPGPGGPTQTMHATLSFSNYRVNKGIADSVFTSKDPPRSR